MFTVPGALAFYSWADGSRDALFSHLESMRPDTFRRVLPGFGIPTIRDTLIHVAEIERTWRDTLLCGNGCGNGESGPGGNLPGHRPSTLADVEALFEENGQLTRIFLEQLSDHEFSARRVVFLPWDGARRRVSPAWVLLHVLTHEFHHRGQVAAMCRSLGAPAANLDLALPATVGSM
jgi:uncharacterized damage-inducible protein DinB